MRIKPDELKSYVGKNIQVELGKVREGQGLLIEWWENKTIIAKLSEFKLRDEKDPDSGWIKLEKNNKLVTFKFDKIISMESL